MSNLYHGGFGGLPPQGRGKPWFFQGKAYKSHGEAALAETMLRHGIRLEYEPIVAMADSWSLDFRWEPTNWYPGQGFSMSDGLYWRERPSRTYFQFKTSLLADDDQEPILWDTSALKAAGKIWVPNRETLERRMETVWRTEPDASLVLIEQRPPVPIPSPTAVWLGQGEVIPALDGPLLNPRWSWAEMVVCEHRGPATLHFLRYACKNSGPDWGLVWDKPNWELESADTLHCEEPHEPLWPLPPFPTWQDRGRVAELGYRSH